MISSIIQFVGYISLLAAGVGGVTRAALYKPLAERDMIKVSEIIQATKIFMRKVAFIFGGVLIGIAVIYPFFVRDDFDWFFVFSIVLILGVGTLIRYYLGITYEILLSADQKKYIHTIIQIGTTILNTAVAAYLIVAGHEIRVVKLASAIVFALNPVFIHLYVIKRYEITRMAKPDNSVIKQRWDAVAHQIANFIHSNAALFILAAFVGVWEVSVYVIYYMVIRSIRGIIQSLRGPAIEALFGDMLAKKQHKTVEKSLHLFEYINNSISAIFITCTAILIVPFVSVYTTGIYDVNYYRPLFALLICAGELFNNIRIPYQSLTKAAGHYKQTRNGAIVEVCINIIVSLILVQQLGLIGVAVGTLCAMIFRTIQYAVYVSRNIVSRNIRVFVRRLLLTFINIGVIVIASRFLPSMVETTFMEWVSFALTNFGVAVGVTMLFSVLFYRSDLDTLVQVAKDVISVRKEKAV